MATTTDIVATTTTGLAIAVGQMVSGIQRQLSPSVPFLVGRSPTEHLEVGSPLAGAGISRSAKMPTFIGILHLLL
jgi:hypothetical protein